ncbi:MAG TPA: hypothetical protein VLZ83_14095 [Edaphocola sp.]|nr:hypothetical protein [Edaphocola sp.]
MSLSYQPLNSVLIRDPITQVNSQRDYGILKGGNQVTWKKYTTTSVTNSSITWSCPPPSGNVFVDRKQYMILPVRLVFTAPGDETGLVLNAGADAPRAYPLNGSIDTLQASINGQSFSIFIADMIHALTHYNTDIKLNNKDYSLTPNYQDQSQEYSDLGPGNIRNPLGGYQNGIHQTVMQRGAFPFTIVQNTANQAVVDMVICEPLFLSPFFWGCGNSAGFYNVTTMDFNVNFTSNFNRFWSHINMAGSNPLAGIRAEFNNFTNVYNAPFSYSESQPILLFKYVTPDSTQILSPNMPITYPYFDVQRYPIDFPTAVSPGGVNSTGLISSNNLQLNSIPRMMYIYARHSNASYAVSGTGSTLTDTYLSLENINITFANYTGLLSSASKQQLYQLSIKNGCGMNWTQWSGEHVNNSSSFVTPVDQYGTIGSILAVEFATDLGLPSDMAPGLQGQFQLQVNAQFKNTSGANVNATLFIIIVSEGSFTIPGLNSATKQLGVITKEDVLNAQTKPGISYDEVQESLYGGGNFLSNLRNFGSKLNNFLKNTKLISNVASSIPHPYAQTVGNVAKSIGYGQGGVVIDPSQYGGVRVGGVPVGGRKLTRAELKQRLA